MRLRVTKTANTCPIEIAANISRWVAAKIPQLRSRSYSPNHSFDLPAFFALAHRALAAAESAALPAAVNLRLGFRAAFPCAAILFATPARMLAIPWALSFFFGAVPLIFAHLALAAAAMALRPAALIFRFLGASVGADSTVAPRSLPSSFCSDWIFSWMSAALRNCVGDRFVIEFMVKQLRLSVAAMSTQKNQFLECPFTNRASLAFR